MSQTPPEDEMTGFGPTERISRPPDGGAASPAPSTPPARPLPESGNALPVGTFLGEFEIRGLAGEGGFGIVYKAWDHSLRRQVAIKEYLPASLASRGGGMQVSVRSERDAEPFLAGLQSFVKEARMLAQFDHPSLVKVYRFWEANGSAYMVMPFYEGRTLRDELRTRTGPPDEATLLGWIGPVADALAVIHAELWYHRDIAPDNILLLAGSQRPLLLDFGAARRVIGDMTQALTVILKPGYAPVEQYAEIPGMKQGPWTDVYALAGVACFALRGRTPPPSVGRLVNDSYEPLASSLRGRYSARVLQAIDHALVVRPDGRTGSVTEFKAELGLEPPPLEAPGLFAPTPMPAHPAVIAPAATGPDLALPLDEPAPATVRMAPPAVERAPPPPPLEHPRALPPPPAAPAPRSASVATGRRWLGIGLAAAAVALMAGLLAWRPSHQPPPAANVAAPPAAAAPTLAAGPAAAPVAPRPAAPDVAAEFDRVVAAQTPGWGLEVKVDRESLRIGKDKLVFTLRSLQEGYVYVFSHSADGVLQQLYPNALTAPPRIAKGGALRLPQGALEFNVDGPPGTNRLLVLVSRWPRDYQALSPREENGFRTYPTGAEAAALVAGDRPPLAGRASCPTAAPCSDEFGAATTRFDAVP